MGFYLDLKKAPDRPEYAEREIPSVFWVLYAIAGFALLCMGGAAYSLLGDLLRTGSAWDRLLVGMIVASVPFYLLAGVKLAGTRKFVAFAGDELRFGFRLFGWVVKQRRFSRTQISEVILFNRRPSPNQAPRSHQDSQYYIRGHWRVAIGTTPGKVITLDKNTEKAALEPLYQDLMHWWQRT
jgi:hypothetical protein